MNWIELKALNKLYTTGRVKLNNTLVMSGEFRFIHNSLKLIERTSSEYIAVDGFSMFYEANFQTKYTAYNLFLTSNNLLKPQTRLSDADIAILMNIQNWKQDGTLEELRRQIIASDESLRGVSQMFFRNEKYLDNKPSLVEALKKILDVRDFANEKDQQYIYKLECHNPVEIVLCENLNFLTMPNKPRNNGIELWYAGGKNVGKLDYADTRGLPIYYSCDWDYDGLFVIYPLVKEKIPSIKLLTPNGPARSITETEHNSLWPTLPLPLDSVFSDKDQRKLAEALKKNNQWIIEESNSILTMLGIEN